MKKYLSLLLIVYFGFGCQSDGYNDNSSKSEVYLEKEIKITDSALHFDGQRIKDVKSALNSKERPNSKYDYKYGPLISPHGDAVKAYKHFVFMTWYRGGKYDRHMMLSRLNTLTGQLKHIEFPHQHTGLVGRWWVGESHNTIAVGISPKEESLHLIFDIHAYGPQSDTGGNGSFKKDYFRYAYSIEGAATVPDDEFTLSLFVKDTSAHSEGENDYNHLSLTGEEDAQAYSKLTYPKFFQNGEGDLFVYVRQGTSHDGKGVFASLKGKGQWTPFQSINKLNVKENGLAFNWSNYGKMKFANGTLGFAFQRRLNNKQDKYRYQNGIYFLVSSDPLGQSDWKNYKGEAVRLPLIDASPALVMEPGDLVATQAKDQVYITGGFDWTITDKGDVHIISRVKDSENDLSLNLHHYKPAGEMEFTTTSEFVKANNIYTSNGNVYIVGLDDGQPYIERAPGGTNQFERVYQGVKQQAEFSSGVVYVYKGKLYFYLLAEGEGDKRSTYLHIINLAGLTTGLSK